MGEGRSLLGNLWLVNAGKPKGPKGDDHLLRFDTALEYGPVSLDGPSAANDRLTKKLCLAASMSGALVGSMTSGSSLYALANNLDWFFRWRRDRGVARSQDLLLVDYEAFISALRGGGTLALVDVGSRLDRLEADVRAGHPFPFGSNYQGQAIDWELLASRLGLSAPAILQSKSFRTRLFERLRRALPECDRNKLQLFDPNLGSAVVRLGQDRVRDILQSWRCLSECSDAGFLGHDPLSFRPFRHLTVTQTAKRLGTKPPSPKTLLPNDFVRLLRAAATWVVRHSDHVIVLAEVLRSLTPGLGEQVPAFAILRSEEELRLAGTAPEGFPPTSLLWKRPDKRHYAFPAGLTVAEAVRCLMTAVGVLVAAFGARTLGEVGELKVGCVARTAAGLHVLSTADGTMADLDAIPVPKLVAHAVAALERLTASTREVTGQDWLFQFSSSSDGSRHRFIDIDLSEDLDAFAAVCGLAPPDGFGSWSGANYQLKRGFAVMYYHGYASATVDELSLHLRQPPGSVKTYILEVLARQMGRLRERIEARQKTLTRDMSPEEREALTRDKRLLADLAARGEAFDEARCEAVVYTMLRTYRGEEVPTGPGASRMRRDLRAIVAEAEAEVRLGSRTNDPCAVEGPLIQRLATYAKTHRQEPVPGVPVHCTAQPGNEEHLASAKCLKLKEELRIPRPDGPAEPDTRPDDAYVSDSTCISCVHCVCLLRDRHEIAEKEARLGAEVAKMASKASGEGAEAAFSRYKALAERARASRDDA